MVKAAESLKLERKGPKPSPLILIVEDHDDTRFLFCYVMQRHGWRVIEAKDGEEALHVLQTAHPALVLMDLSLPRMDGLTAMHRMRQLRAFRTLPVIIVSGHAQPEFAAQALAEGANDYFVKPVDLHALATAVEKLLGRRKPRKRLAVPRTPADRRLAS